MARLALSWTQQQGVAVMLPPGEEKLFDIAMKVLPECKPLTDEETATLKNTAATLAAIF
jgi:hypothetical protein